MFVVVNSTHKLGVGVVKTWRYACLLVKDCSDLLGRRQHQVKSHWVENQTGEGHLAGDGQSCFVGPLWAKACLKSSGVHGHGDIFFLLKSNRGL